MIYRRAELHNHSTESDGSMTVEELLEWAENNQYDVMALTDHNTCSGHGKAHRVIQENNLSVSLLEGVEVTTFYGHILALGLRKMVDFTGLNPMAPENFLQELRREGAAAIGIAHPFCLGRPVMAGCRFDMKIHDWNTLDYIEVFNTSAGTGTEAELSMGNEKALQLWEEKALEGYSLAAVTGKDIHKKPGEWPVMVTYVQLDNPDIKDPAQAVLGAILEQRTIVTKGPLFYAQAAKGILTIQYDNTSSYLEWNTKWETTHPLLLIQDNLGNCLKYEVDLKEEKQEFKIACEADRVVLRMYDGNIKFSSLLAAGVVVKQEK